MDLIPLDAQDIVKLVATMAILLYANYLDWKYREIDDRSWISLILVGVIFFLVDLIQNPSRATMVHFALSFGIAIIMGLVFFYTGLWGGGDSKILFGLGAVTYNIALPHSILPLFILGIFVNSVLFSIVVPLRFLIANLGHLPKVSSWKELVACFIGYRKRVSDINEFEAVFGVGGKFQLLMDANTMEMGAKDLPRDKIVWVTPGIPFLIPISMGFVFALFFGDLMTILFFRGQL